MFIARFYKKRSQIFRRAEKAMATFQRILPGGMLEEKRPGFRKLFPRGVRIRRLVTGFQFTEGPIWFSEGNYLLFSDIPANRIFKLTPNGKVSIFREPSGHSNGLTRDRQGRLIACEHGNRRVTRTEQDGSITVLADSFQGKPLNSPNDVVVKFDGAIYFTDPPYGIKSGQQVQPTQGVYRLSPDAKELHVVVQDFDRPNGLAFSPDQTKLYIDDSSSRRHIRVFDVRKDGSVANGRLFHDMNIQEQGAPDGMKVDEMGHLYCTGPRGIWVFNPAGDHLGTILTPEQPANCAWGDEDFRSLFITARTSVYRVRVIIPGMKVG
ncbi:MAG: SMP-30/gluconolactonase/LRE family protein [Nitrospirae bacterium]|nr:SMP-30/gluconolactonase/LRE family protein [Nitrospirota bacterium]